MRFALLISPPSIEYSFPCTLLEKRTVLNIWFTADFHLGHKNIIRYCNRPFQTVEEMNQEILERLNSRVKANDILYFLGDFCIGPKARAAELRQQIPLAHGRAR
jgi:calcineurin-like phosphoesterase family protein